MEEAELQKQRNMVTRSSSIKRKPLSNLTNIVRKPYPISPFSQSKPPGSSTASDSSIGSTQNPLITPPNHPLPSTPPRFTPAHLVGNELAYTQRKSTRKTSSKLKTDVPLCSSTMEKINDKQKPIGVSITSHNTKNTKNIMETKDKGKSIAVSLTNPPSMKTLNTKDKGKTVMNSTNFDLSQKDEGNLVFTPIYHRTLKKDKRSSCPPLLRTYRNENVGVEDAFQSKLQTEPPPNKKKRCSSKEESVEEYVLPQEFVDQQRAYFKEIDDFELEVEEVE